MLDWTSRRPTIRSFQLKLTLVFALSMLFALALSDFLIYRISLISQFQALRDRLTLIARTTAVFVDADTLQRIPLTKEGMLTSEYLHIASQLRRIKAVNPQIAYIYTMMKTNQPGIWQFVVDPDPAIRMKGELLTSLPGDIYDARRFPEMLQAFEIPIADKRLYTDEWGVSLSGYAPIRNQRGEAVAIVGVDMAANDVFAVQQEVHWRMFLVVGLGMVMAIFLAMVGSRKITTPLQELMIGTRKLAEGNLSYQVQIKGETEFHELANSFNSMAQRLSESRRRILSYFFGVVRSLIKILELRDQYTRGHSESVAILAGKIATRMGFSQDVVKVFKRVTLLHDIGKLGVKDSILNKPGPLTDQEWEEMRQHPVIGENILRSVVNDEQLLGIVRGHHERYDGKGYPDRTGGESLNLFAAIVTVADAYDAMTSDRSYRKAMSMDAAIEEIERHRGTQFHPRVVDAFLEVMAEEKNRKQTRHL